MKKFMILASFLCLGGVAAKVDFNLDASKIAIRRKGTLLDENIWNENKAGIRNKALELKESEKHVTYYNYFQISKVSNTIHRNEFPAQKTKDNYKGWVVYNADDIVKK